MTLTVCDRCAPLQNHAVVPLVFNALWETDRDLIRRNEANILLSYFTRMLMVKEALQLLSLCESNKFKLDFAYVIGKLQALVRETVSGVADDGDGTSEWRATDRDAAMRDLDRYSRVLVSGNEAVEPPPPPSRPFKKAAKPPMNVDTAVDDDVASDVSEGGASVKKM
jgi:hypothetical protein